MKYSRGFQLENEHEKGLIEAFSGSTLRKDWIIKYKLIDLGHMVGNWSFIEEAGKLQGENAEQDKANLGHSKHW